MVVLTLLACWRQSTEPTVPHLSFPTAADALRYVVRSEPKVLGVGEFHSRENGPQVRSALSYFTDELLPVLAPRTTDLVIETWVLDGTCGAEEKNVEVTLDVELDRPEATKDEIVLLAERARTLGVQPHALTLSCADYASVLDENGALLDGELLEMLTVKQRELAMEALGIEPAVLVLYSGAVHNDIWPSEALLSYSYGPPLRAAAGERYVALDLYVPELVSGIAGLEVEPWFPLLAAAGSESVMLFERGPGSWILFLPATR